MTGFREQFAAVGDLKIFYAEAGAGDPVFCLHGTGPGASGVSNFAANIGALAERFRVIVPDLPRFGRSSKVIITEPRLDYLSGVIRGLMDTLGIARAHFIGNSMGGQAALKLAIDSPDRVGRLVLVAPAPLRHSVFTPMPADAVRQIAGYYQGEGPSREKMRLLLTSLVHNPAAVTEELLEQRYAASIDPEVVAVNSGPPWAVQSLDGELERATAPALLVWGIDDRASPFDQAITMLRRLPDARLHVFARCGHSVQLEHPGEFNRLVLDFLAEQQPTPP
jgi:2-hydroxy-6-oxonona-2,4-dienedioate hydrolase/4,5:9,10-diseco-3-hydroxy-5,9,17-trioxoandrosta-1(10),2-diene-4-oate hydrolase